MKFIWTSNAKALCCLMLNMLFKTEKLLGDDDDGDKFVCVPSLLLLAFMLIYTFSDPALKAYL